MKLFRHICTRAVPGKQLFRHICTRAVPVFNFFAVFVPMQYLNKNKILLIEFKKKAFPIKLFKKLYKNFVLSLKSISRHNIPTFN